MSPHFEFCWCGRLLTEDIKFDWGGNQIKMGDKWCPRHGKHFKEKPTGRVKVGHYSGKSKSVNKFNEYQ